MRQSRQVRQAFNDVEHHLARAKSMLKAGAFYEARAHALDAIRSSGELAIVLGRISDRNPWMRRRRE